MEPVFVLWHSHPTGANELNEKLIGIYASRHAALEAQGRVSTKPGFSAYPEGFEIVEYTVGSDNWTEGYFTE
jgi:hypothetical protein